MGYTTETLPLSRTSFWGGRILPVNGVNKKEWWPTSYEESSAVAVYSDEYLDKLIALYGESGARKVVAHFSELEVFEWFIDNFTKEAYTDDYAKEVDETMVRRGLSDFQRNVAASWLELQK